MKKSVLSLLILFAFINGTSQKTIQVDRYLLPDELPGEKILVITMPFGKADILSISGDTAALERTADIFIDVIFTDFPAHASLLALNKSRLSSFIERFPGIGMTDIARVNFLRQMDGTEKENAENMFHGLVISYRPGQSVATMKADIAGLDLLLEKIDIDTVVGIDVISPERKRDSIILQRLREKKGISPKRKGPVKYEKKPWDMTATGYDRKPRSVLDSSLIITPKDAYKKGLITKAAYKSYDWTPWIPLFFRPVGDTSFRKSVYLPKKEVTPVLSKTPAVIPISDSTLMKIFSRTNWTNFTVVEDVTVSMYPYAAQLLMWIKLKTIERFTNSFVFFNDGNEMPDKEKVTGNTGGIYFKNCDGFKEVRMLIKEAMEKGSGGDRPENDIEALLAGEREFSGKDFQVLIADNRAPIKDMILVNKLTKPVRVILCGADEYNINVDYLNLARQTKGSVHLIEQDLKDLASLQEGAVLKIGRKNYKIENGNFKEPVVD